MTTSAGNSRHVCVRCFRLEQTDWRAAGPVSFSSVWIRWCVNHQQGAPLCLSTSLETQSDAEWADITFWAKDHINDNNNNNNNRNVHEQISLEDKMTIRCCELCFSHEVYLRVFPTVSLCFSPRRPILQQETLSAQHRVLKTNPQTLTVIITSTEVWINKRINNY